MNNEIKAIFIDSEGTLKDQNNQISEITKKAIDKLKSKGIYVVITTGLPRFIARKIALSSHASSYVIASNGADIYDLKEDRIINGEYLHSLVVNDIIDNTSKFNIILGVGDKEYCNGSNSYCKNGFPLDNYVNEKKFFQCHISQKDGFLSFEEAISEIREFIRLYGIEGLKSLIGNELLNISINNIDYLKDNPKLMDLILRAVRFVKLKSYQQYLLGKYSDKIRIGNQSINFTDFQMNGEIPWFSLNTIGVSKGEGIKKFCQCMNIQNSPTMGIGNDYNDLSMIQNVSLFSCPTDAYSLIKDKAQITFERTEDGIGKLLQKICR